MTPLFVCLSLVLGAAVCVILRNQRLAECNRLLQQTKERAAELVDEARTQAERQLTQARTDAAEQKLKRQQQGERELQQRRELLKRGQQQVASWDQTLARTEQQLEAKIATLVERERNLSLLQARQKAAQDRRSALIQQTSEQLQKQAGETFADTKSRLILEWTEQARAAGADRVRQLEQGQNSAEVAGRARRLLEVTSQRYEGHYLTERLLSTLPIPTDILDRVFGDGADIMVVIGEVANIKLTISDERNSVRLEGQDSFGREIARRTLARLIKMGNRNDPDSVRRIATGLAEDLDRETVELGRRAFKELEIPRAHPDIVRLVGRLNYRTSYSQNQWKHAVESAFLCGMLAAELRLDMKIARRAALMHDIGKSLTHAIDGSHAVIGADYARRLGESEQVANAIGAHHLDEPFNSPYALIVAASDAMSGGRPGARHEQEGSHIQRIDDLEKLALGSQGVDRCYALQAGRELRIHVRENQVDDLRAALMATELAQKISDNLVFPGQIKVTVIRELNVVSVAN
ncbi:MAG: Rnase Y domain-containing protein [Polyangia bacterium]